MTTEGLGGAFVSVAVPVPLRRTFSYTVPEAMRAAMRRGARVRVPFGRRKVTGTVVEWPGADPDPGIETKDVEAILESAPPLDEAVLELTRFAAGYYLCSWGEAIAAALPPEARPGPATIWVRRAPGADPSSIPTRATARRRAFESLPADGSAIPAGRLGRAGRSVLASLERSGLVERFERSAAAAPRRAARAEAAPRLQPTAEQAAALSRLLPAVSSPGYAPFLLFGPTGSGKTEVYLRAAEAALERGRGVLYLVPEIGLTPLLVSRLEVRFPGRLAVLHSGLGARERNEEWGRVGRGEARFVVGARSAVFAPVRDLGLLVVDEEQESSYKQEDSPRYNARDLAVVRAREAGATLVLGSATPSLESFHHAATGRYTLLRIVGRVRARPLPAVEVVDMREEFRRSGRALPLSAGLVEALRECLGRGEQAMVLRNRRGWASAVVCPSCGGRVSCGECSIAMTWHRAARRLVCHYCGRERTLPLRCPACGALDLKLLGEGTERIEDELRSALPGVRLARMDRDTVRRRGAQEALLRRFGSGGIDVLLGTQMIAKGHDFPGVTVVGVLSADQALGLPDFRAAERTFQLLTQVAGRAGRGDVPGRVLLQAYDPAHPVLKAAAAQDYEAFYREEMAYRRALRYPPLTSVVEIVVEDRDAARAATWAGLLADAVREEGGGRLMIAGPGPAPVERIRGKYRRQILARSAGRRRLVTTVERALARVEGRIPLRALRVDVDPVSVL